MKIVGSCFGSGDGKRANAFGFDGNYVVLVLQAALDEQELLMNDHGVILLKKLRGNDGVRNAGFIFEAEKHKTLGGAGTLARDHRTRDANFRSIRQAMQVHGRENTLLL